MEYSFITPIHFMLWWHCSIWPFPEGTCTEWNWRHTPHSFRKSRKGILQNSISLSMSISVDGLHSQNRSLKWLVILTASCHLVLMRDSKPCQPAVNEQQVVSVFVVGYVHPHLAPCVAHIQFILQSMCGWQVNWVTLFYHCLYWHRRDNRIYFPDKVQCLLYARMTTSSMAEHYLARVGLVCWCSTNMVWGLSCFLDQIKTSLQHSHQTIC